MSATITGRTVEVVAWGDDWAGQSTVPAGLTEVVAMAAGGEHSLALRADGTVVAWGSNDSGKRTVPADLTEVVAIAAGANHSLALRADGTVVGWGYNFYGQRTVPASLTEVVAIAAGGEHSLALRADATVVAWGRNEHGQSTVPATLTEVVAIAAGGSHTLGLRSDGVVVAWGLNSDNQCAVPEDLTEVVAIAAGWSHSLALRADGTVVAWGSNGSGERTVPAGLTEVVAMAAGYEHSLALRADGTVVAWGGNRFGQSTLPEGLSDVVAIAAGAVHSLALTSLPAGVAKPEPLGPAALVAVVDRAVFRELRVKNGATSYDAEGLPPGLSLDSLTGLITGAPSADGRFEVLLSATNDTGSSDWTMVIYVNLPLPKVVGPGVVSAAYGSGFSYSLTLINVDRVDAVGLPAGLTVDPSSGVVAGSPRELGDFPVSLLVSNAYGVSTENMIIRVSLILAWGAGWAGQNTVPGDVSEVLLAVAAGDGHNLALRADGTVVAWGDDRNGQSTVSPVLTEVVAIAAGGHHSLALRADGTVVAWGDDRNGQCTVPAFLTEVVAITAGWSHSLALRADGTVVAWGDDQSGQSAVPAGLTEVVAIAAGVSHSLALRADGTVVAWGSNGAGQRTVPAGLTEVVAIAAGGYYNLALCSDGSVVAWGSNSWSQSRVPAGLTEVVAIAAGEGHSLALRADGTVVAWGLNNFGQRTVPGWLDNVVAIAASGYHTLAMMNPAPLAEAVFRDRTINTGQDYILIPNLSSGHTTKLQWYRDGAWLDEGSTLLISDAQETDAGLYTAVAEFDSGALTLARIQLSVATVGVNTPPVLDPVADQAVDELSLFTLSLTASDSDLPANTLTFSLTEGPEGMTLDPVSGILNWTPTEAQGPGVYTVRVTVTDDGDPPLSDTATFTVVVRAVAVDPPTIQIPSVWEGGEFTVRVMTVAGRTYVLEYKNALTDAEWQPADEVLGDGTERLLSDPAPELPTRFYRVGVVPGS